MINWVAGAAAGEVLCLHYKDGDGDFGLNMKSLFIAEVSFVRCSTQTTDNTTHFSHRIYNFVCIISESTRCTVESEHAWARVRTEPQPRPPAGDPQHPRADLLQALILILQQVNLSSLSNNNTIKRWSKKSKGIHFKYIKIPKFIDPMKTIKSQSFNI